MEFWKSTSYLVTVTAALGGIGTYLILRAGAAAGDGCLISGSADYGLAAIGVGVIMGGMWASYNAGREDEKTRPR